MTMIAAQEESLDQKRYQGVPVKGENKPLELPDERMGPIAQGKVSRILRLYVFGFIASLSLLLFTDHPALYAFALGTMVPGGGLWYADHIGWSLFTMLLFFASITANRYALPTIWLGSATLAGMIVGPEVCHHAVFLMPAVGVGIVGLLQFGSLRRLDKARVDIQHLNQALVSNPPLTIRSAPGFLGDTLNEQGMAQAKFILDRALQPLEEFNGLRELEPFGTSALRYQLNYAQYALALLNYCHTPAFSGYMHEAQRRLIVKMADLKAWRYWRVENVWGNLDTNPDPIRRDNIMFSGYLGQMIGMYAEVSGDMRFNDEHAFNFRWKDGREFHYCQASINQAIADNFARSEFCLYPCEPNWSYTMCNPFGLNSLLSNDEQLGSHYLKQLLPQYRHMLQQEFMTADGHYVPFRSMLWGIQIPGFVLDVNNAIAAFMHHPSIPDIAETSWELMRYRAFQSGQKFPFQLTRRGRTDIGNYRKGMFGPYACLMMAAKEFGDEEVFQSLRNAIDEHYEPVLENGELSYTRISNLTQFCFAIASFIRPGAFYDLLNLGMPVVWKKGPQLAYAPFPDVMVYRAVTDGRALQLGLQTDVVARAHPLRLERLVPKQQYRVVENPSCIITADHTGAAQFQPLLRGRNSLTIVPVE